MSVWTSLMGLVYGRCTTSYAIAPSGRVLGAPVAVAPEEQVSPRISQAQVPLGGATLESRDAHPAPKGQAAMTGGEALRHR
jgi:hypothetical protein